MKELKWIGLWKSKETIDFPDPAWFVDNNWEQQIRLYIINYLRSGKILFASTGPSWCRFRCPKRFVGSLTLTDGTYIWPEGLVHYLEDHSIKLPKEFVVHALKNRKEEVNLDEINFNHDWWKNQKGWKEGNTYLTPALNGKLVLYTNEIKATSKIIKYLKQFEICEKLSTKEILEKLRQEDKILLQNSFYYYDYFEVQSKSMELNINIEFEFND